MRRLVTPVVAAMLVLSAGGAVGRPAAGQPPGQVTAGTRAAAGTPVCTVGDERLPEVSGLAATGDGYVVVNDSFPRAVMELQQILDGAGAALRATRPELAALVSSLLA